MVWISLTRPSYRLFCRKFLESSLLSIGHNRASVVMFLFQDHFIIRLDMFINQLNFTNNHKLSKCCHAIRASSLSFGPSLLIGCQGIPCFVPAEAYMFLIGLFGVTPQWCQIPSKKHFRHPSLEKTAWMSVEVVDSCPPCLFKIYM